MSFRQRLEPILLSWMCQWRRIPPRSRRRALALCASTALHLLILLMLLSPGSGRRGIASLGAMEGAERGTGSQTWPVSIAYSDTRLPKYARAETSSSEASATPSAPVAPRAEASAAEHPAVRASESDGPAGANGNASLLSQIADCLPEGERPALAAATLNVHLDSDGKLIDAPRVDFAATASQSGEDIRVANDIVQAALLCGPYRVAAGKPATFALVPDFSAPAVATN